MDYIGIQLSIEWLLKSKNKSPNNRIICLPWKILNKCNLVFLNKEKNADRLFHSNKLKVKFIDVYLIFTSLYNIVMVIYNLL